MKKATTRTKDFLNDEDRKETDDLTRDSSTIIKIQNGEKVPIYLLKSEYQDGYAHWLPTPSGDNVRIPCVGGTEGKGRDPDNCPICRYVNELFSQAKNAKGAKAKLLKDRAFKMRGSYEIYFIAAKGSVNVVKIDKKTNKKTTQVEFDEASAGLLRLTKTQYQALRGLPAKYDFITSNKDLFNRYIIMDKQVRDEDEYATIEFRPSAKITKKPDVAIPDNINLDELFVPDLKLAKNTLNLMLNDDADDEELEFEDEEGENVARGKSGRNSSAGTKSKKAHSRDEEEELDDDFESDDETDDEDDSESDDEESYDDEEEIDDEEEEDDDEEDVEESDDEEEEESDFDDDFLDDVDDDFEDDNFDDEEEEPIRPKKGAKKMPKKTETVEKPAGKRGRPAKAATPVKEKAGTKKTAKVAEAPKRGRGRPPKAASEKAAPAKTTKAAPAKTKAKAPVKAAPAKKTSRKSAPEMDL